MIELNAEQKAQQIRWAVEHLNEMLIEINTSSSRDEKIKIAEHLKDIRPIVIVTGGEQWIEN